MFPSREGGLRVPTTDGDVEGAHAVGVCGVGIDAANREQRVDHVGSAQTAGKDKRAGVYRT